MSNDIRVSVRAVILNPKNEVLLMDIGTPEKTWCGLITPGGGIEPGETELQALTRDLEEELGTFIYPTPQKIWNRYHEFDWEGKWIKQKEIFFFIKLDEAFMPEDVLGAREKSNLHFNQMRWYKLAELENKSTAPRNLLKELLKILERGIPKNPYDIDV